MLISKRMKKKLVQQAEREEEVQEEERNEEKRKGSENDIQELMPFKKIENGLIWREDGSIQAVIGVDSLHYHLLSENEKRTIDGALGSLLSSLSFPVQPLSITRPVDLGDYVDSLRNVLDEAPESMKEYGQDHILFLEEKTRQEVLIKYDYLVFGVEHMDDEQKMKAELDRRAGLILSGLRRAGMYARVLDTPEVAAVFYDIFHGNRAIRQRIQDAFRHDYFSLYVSRKEEQPQQGLDAPPPPEMVDKPEPSQPMDKEERKRLVMLG
ncbi:hypothetical protein [Caldalkalibacillus thermarum]|uniref:hypothetical protein n=1 Tax=Caldalkalibacillus thermarum TaxID=296745 RepID=UPI00166628DF|nr:hypothetical protein [Caldalkalibacillus thermarum]